MRRALPVILILFLTLSSLSLLAQKKFFAEGRQNQQFNTNKKRVLTPEKYSGTSLDNDALKTFLWSLPTEKTVQRSAAPILLLPMPDGSTARFRVWESSVMGDKLQARFSEIRTFAGQGVDDPSATIRLDYNPYFGFHAQVLSPKGRIYVDPYAQGDTRNYMSYYHRDNKRNPPFICEVPETPISVTDAARVDAACRGTQLYKYRLAVACTGEYAQAVGAGNDSAALHAAIVTTVNRVDGVYESELSIRLILIDNNTDLEFLTPSTDPFNGNNSPGTLIGESQSQITTRIGAANYDIGHTFSTGAGGLAGLGVVCINNQKARGVTGRTNPVGDGYDIDYVAHEIGHQFGANHTFNSVTSNCNGNRNTSTAYEVGSGTTIMAYAGICGSDDIQPNSDPFFHAVSFDEISNYVENDGAACRQVEATNNTLPVITSMDNNGVSIPLRTPFTLTGSATDADGDPLTYSWEEWDLGPSGIWSSGANNATSPLFKSRTPKADGSRTFPDISVIAANYPANPAGAMGGLKGESLPTVGRTMKFRLTVRDNRANGGGVVSGGSGCASGGFTAPFQVTAVPGTGPFVVTAPNGGETFPGGTAQTITWNVAGSDLAPINCTNVKILLSTDGGLTYPTELVGSTANDGTESVVLPGVITTTARIRVEAVGNIFFDISNANFSITAPISGFDFNSPAAVTFACGGPANVAVSLGTVAFIGFTTPINLTASNVPAGATVTFGTNPVAPGNATQVTLNNTNALANGTYAITITGTAGAITRTRVLTFIITAGAGPVIGTQPQAVQSCQGTNVSFVVAAAGAISYQWQVSTNNGGSYSNIAGATTGTLSLNNISNATQNGNLYRALVIGQCGTTTSSAVQLTVQLPAAITAQPQTVTLCQAATATFTVAASGGGLSYQWQVKTPTGTFTNIPGATNATLSINNITAALDGNQYRAVVTGTCAPGATSNAAILNVVIPVTVSQSPVAFVNCETGNAAFSVTAVGQNILYQWQVSTDGGVTFTDIAGEISSTLTLSNITSAMNNNQYRALVSNSICTVPAVSAPATLTVNARPTIILSAQPLISLLPGQSTTISANISPAPTGFDITWLKNNIVLPGITGTSYLVDSVEIGEYQVRIINPTTGCNNESQILTITTAASSRLFIFPNPNNGQFTVSYYNAGGANGQQTITIYDGLGHRVYQTRTSISGPYTLTNVDLRGRSRGVYYVVVGDASGKKIVDGKVMIQ